MDVQLYLSLFQWAFLMHIPANFGFPHNPLQQTSEYPTSSKTSSNFKVTSNTQVPYFFHKDVINNRNILKVVQQQTGDQNGANLEDLEKYIKHKGIIVKNSNSVVKTSFPGNKQGIDSYLRYLPRNLRKYTSHSKQKETQNFGIGSVLDAGASKHLSHLSGLQIIQNVDTYSTDDDISVHNKKQNQWNKWPKTKTEEDSERRTLGRILNSKAHLHIHKRHVIATNQEDNINLAVLPNDNVTRDHGVVNMILSIGAGLVVLGMGTVLGIFSCCCKKKKGESEKDREEQSAIINTAEDIDKGLPDAKVDLSESFREDDEPKSIKDKIKAFENEKKPILAKPTEMTPQGRIKNSEAFSALEGKQLFIGGMTKPPKVIVRDDQDDNRSKDEGLGDTTESRTDDLSKSDTHEEVSEIALDNTSTHSSISQPHNPDVVIASDDEDEFADIQRGTVILKSFQRAKPPRNRSPATRSNRKLRKSPGQVRRSDRDSPDISSGMDSLSPMMSQSLYVESASEKLEDTRDKSDSVPENLDKLVEPVNVSKSLKKSTGETENQSKPKGGSSQEVDKTDKSKDIPNGARYKKNTDSPLTKPKYRRKEREKERDKESEPSADSDSNKRISVSELGSMFENKQKGLPSAIDNNKTKTEDIPTKTPEQTKSEEANENNVKRLSGLPPNVNNIFYLIDPTVKDKCRSTGDVNASNNHSKGKSKEFAHKKDKASKHKHGKDNSKEAEEVIPRKRERTFSDPQRHSKECENTAL